MTPFFESHSGQKRNSSEPRRAAATTAAFATGPDLYHQQNAVLLVAFAATAAAEIMSAIS